MKLRNNVEQKKPGRKAFIFYDSIYRKTPTRTSKITVLEVEGLSFGQRVGDEKDLVRTAVVSFPDVGDGGYTITSSQKGPLHYLFIT